MTVGVDNIRNWLGPSAEVLDDNEIQECINMATDVVTQLVKSAGGSGVPDTPVKYVTAANVYRALDARNVKPASISEGGVSVSTDVGTAVDQFMTYANNAIKSYVNATAGTQGRGDRYLYQIRGGCRCRRR